MTVPFKLYAWTWLLILILYSFNWSKFSIPLDNGLLFFLIFTIIISFLFGYLLKPFQFKFAKKASKKTKHIVLAIWCGFIINFIHAGYIPFFGTLSGKYYYTEFPGIPTLYPFLISFSAIYYFYLMYLFFSFKKKSYLIQSFLILLIFLFVFSRSLLVFCGLGSFLMYYILNRQNKTIKINILKKYIILFCFIFFICYIFGGLGNLRCGYSWNDCSYIERLGMYDNFPSWLPKQFMWVHSYLISPLANLNYNIIQNHHIYDVNKLFVSYVPEFISKRFFENLVTTSLNETLLIRTYFNAQTTYVESYYCLVYLVVV